MKNAECKAVSMQLLTSDELENVNGGGWWTELAKHAVNTALPGSVRTYYRARDHYRHLERDAYNNNRVKCP